MSATKQLSTSLAGLSLALLMSVWAPSASAQTADNPFCQCMCMEGSPEYICVQGFSTNETLECPASVCAEAPDAGGSDSGSGGADVPADDTAGSGNPVEPPDAVDPPVAQDGSAVRGLECRMRKIYRPDLGRYKRHKVCRLTPERRAELREQLAGLGERQESAMERLRAKHERRAARRAERRAARAARRGQQSDD